MIDLSQETEALARRLAAAQSVSVDDAVRQALEARAAAAGILPAPRRPRDQSPEATTARRVRVDRIVREIAAMPVLDPRSPREIMAEEGDDLAWAKPYVDEALAAVDRGEVMTLEEHKARMAARLAALKD